MPNGGTGNDEGGVEWDGDSNSVRSFLSTGYPLPVSRDLE